MKTLHFGVALNELLKKKLSDDCEKMFRDLDEGERNIYLNLIREYLKQQSNFLSKLAEYMLKRDMEGDEEVKLDMELIDSFEGWFMSELVSSEDYRNAVRIKKIEAAGSYVKNKETGEIRQADRGCHWDVIYEFVLQKFGLDIISDSANFAVCDKWIKDNIVIVGNYWDIGLYKFKERMQQIYKL